MKYKDLNCSKLDKSYSNNKSGHEKTAKLFHYRVKVLYEEIK
jgi:hypothetical protein